MIMCPERGWDGGGKSSEEVTVGQNGWSLARMRAGMRERDASFGDAFWRQVTDLNDGLLLEWGNNESNTGLSWSMKEMVALISQIG